MSFNQLIVLFAALIQVASVAVSDACAQQGKYDESVHNQFWTAAFSPNDRSIAVGGVDGSLRIFNAETLKVEQTIPINDWIHVVRWNPDGKTLAVATLKHYVLLMNAATGEMTSLAHQGGSRAMGWNADGTLLAVGDLEGDLQIWSRNGQLTKSIDNKYSSDSSGTSFLSLAWSPKEDVFIATNNSIHLFDALGNELKTLVHPNPKAIMLCTRWHPSGEFFVIGDYGHNWEGENVPSLLHFWSREGVLQRSVSGSRGEYRNIAWNKSGTLLATASDVLRIWDREGKLLDASPEDSINYLWGVDWNSTGTRIVTASRYREVSIWDVQANLLASVTVSSDSP